ncbi:hypothetical protein [Blautia hansenii]|uniref:hypothetical protein n=1 Tax=Blautia hansenii TaxID=1322 RepID=UPI0019202B03|nr:hypothetical protein [Blautia hansenii]MCB5602056.1 hypothetical protein [Blautia hansenii]
MMKKIRGFSLILCACSVLAGCNKSSVDVKEKAGEEIVSMEEAEYSFPEKYEKTSDSGKVKFNCELEVPENIKGQAISTVDVKGLYRCDREKAWTIFGEGKEIIEKPEIPVDEGRAPEDYYLFANDESLDIDEGIAYGSSNSKYYLNIGVTNPDNQAVFEETEVSFKSGEECITELKKIIYVFLTIFLYLLKCPQSLILSALRAFCFCGKPHISRSIFLYFRYQAWLKSW